MVRYIDKHHRRFDKNRRRSHAGGTKVFKEWLEATRMRSHAYVALFDKHKVVDALSHWQARKAAEHVNSVQGFGKILCSFSGEKKRWETCNPVRRDKETFQPFIDALDGKIFCDRKRPHAKDAYFKIEEHVYRPSYMRKHEICIAGNKGAVPKLLRMPCLLFDDQKTNIMAVQESDEHSQGVLVTQGAKVHDDRFTTCSDPERWHFEMHRFAREIGIAHTMKCRNETVDIDSQSGTAEVPWRQGNFEPQRSAYAGAWGSHPWPAYKSKNNWSWTSTKRSKWRYHRW